MHSIRQEDCIFITPPHGQPHATFRRNSGSDVGGFVNKHTVQVCCTCISAIALSLVALWSSSFSSAFQDCPQTSSLMALMKLVVCTRSSLEPQSFSTTLLLWASAMSVLSLGQCCVHTSSGPVMCLCFLWANASFGPVLCPCFLWAGAVPLDQCRAAFGPVVPLGQYSVHASFGPVLCPCFLWAVPCCLWASGPFGPVLCPCLLWASVVSVLPLGQ